MYRSCDLCGYMCIGNVILWIHVYRLCDLYGYMCIGHVIFVDTCV